MRRRLRLRAQLLRRLHRAESGAMAIFIALTTCFVVIPLGALAVDLGTQRVSRSDAQAVADTTALDMARLLATSGPAAVTSAAATTDAAKNSGQVGNGMTVAVYTGTLSSTFVSNQALGCNGTTSNAYFTANVPNPTAVLVVVSNSVDFAIHGGSGDVCRSAIAQANPAIPGTPGTTGTAAVPEQACMTIDSYAAQLNSGDSTVLGPLNQLLGTNVNTTVLGSSGILTTNLNVADFLKVLQVNLGVGSTTQVLSSSVTAAQILSAEITALTQDGQTSAAAALTSQMVAAVSANSTGKFTVGSLLGVSSGNASALSGTVNPLDLASAAVILANGNAVPPHALTVSASSTNLTGLSLSGYVVSGPKLVCEGDGTQTVSQASINATASINGGITGAVTSTVTALQNLLNGVLSGLGTLLTGESYGIPVVTLGTVTANVSLASASGSVTKLNCTNGRPTSMSVQEAASLAPATISVPITITESHTYKTGLFTSTTEYATSTLTLTLSTTASNQSTAATLPLPSNFPTTPATPQSGPAGNLSLGSASVSTTLTGSDGKFPSNGKALLGTMLGGVNSVINSVNSNLVGTVESAALTPLFSTLTSTLKTLIGLTIAGSTYTPTQAVCAVAATSGTSGTSGTAATPPKLVG